LSFDNKAQVLEAITGTTSATIENFNRARFTSCAWDSKEGLLVLGDAMGYLHIYDILTDKCIKKEKLFCNGAPMIGLGFSLSLDYMHMVACMANCAIRYVVNRDFKHIELLEHTQTILGIAMDESNEIIDSEPTLTVPSKNRFFTVGQDNFIHCWDSYDMKLIYSFEEKESKMSCAVHAELSRKLITGHENGSIKAWSFDTGNFIRAKDSDEAILCLTCGIISDQEFILTGCVGGTVTTWGLTTDSITLIFVMEVASKEKKEDIVSIVFSSGNFLNQKGAELFVLGLNSGRVLLYNFGKRCLLTELSGHQDSITGLVYDGCILFSSSEDGTLRMWNLIDPTNAYELCKLQTNATKAICTVTSLAVMHDCGFLVCGYNDGSLIVWDYKSFEDESDFKNYGRIVYNTK
jgi:WD40 repeat protein